MAYAFVQGTSGGTSTTGTSNQATGSITVTGGNTLIAWVWQSSATVSGLTDTKSNTWVNVFVSPIIASAYYLMCYVCQGANAGATVVTNTNLVGYGIWVEEISGLNTSAAPLGYATTYYSNGGGGVGANLINSGNTASLTNVPAGVFGFSVNANGTTGSDVGPSVGTTNSPTGRTVPWVGGSAQSTAAAEDYRLTVAGTATATFGTVSGNQYDNFAVGVIVLAEPPAPTISVVPGSANYVNNGTSPATTVYEASLAIGNVGIVGVQDKSGNHTLSVSDNLNGTYTKIYSNYNSTLGGVLSFWYVNVRTPGAATVTVAGNVGDSLVIACFGVQGFLGVPAIDVPVEANFSGTSTATVSMTPVSTNYANEILLASNLSTSYITSGFSGWNEFYSGQSQFFYAIEAAASTSNPFSATMAAAANWAGIIAGLYDSGLTFTPGPVPRQIYILP
jgi:hypothetical protein